MSDSCRIIMKILQGSLARIEEYINETNTVDEGKVRAC